MDPRTNRILFPLLRSAIAGTLLTDEERALFEPSLLPELLALAKKHDIANILAVGLQKNDLSGAAAAHFEQEIFKAVYRHSQLQYEYERLCTAFEEARIAFVPLKGSVLRDFYPEPWMRTSCDIDILVKEEELERAVEAMSAIGYRMGGKNFHDFSLFSENGMHVELHFSLLENDEGIDRVLARPWEFAESEGGYRHRFTDAYFLFHMMAHMVHHFIAGGCGIRSLLDVWVMEHSMGVSPLCAAELLEEAGIARFTEVVGETVDACFSTEPLRPASMDMLNYIIEGGVYGTAEQGMVMDTEPSNLTARYILGRTFPPYRDLALEYPVLKKAPILLPFCWIARTAKLGVRFLQGLFRRKKLSDRVSDEKRDEAAELKKKLGL